MRSLLLVHRGLRPPAWCGSAGTRHQIVTAQGVPAAEELLASSRVDVIVLEAGRNAGALATATRTLARRAPVVIVGPHDADLVREALLAGADDYLDEAIVGQSTISLAVECALARRDVRRKELALRDKRHAVELEHEQSRLRTALINHLADRLLNPATVIRLQASILAKQVGGVDAARLAQMQAAAERLRATVEQIGYAFEAQMGAPNVLCSPQQLAKIHDKALAAAGVGPCAVLGDATVEVDPVHVEEILGTALRWAATIGPGRLAAEISIAGNAALYRLRVPGTIAGDHQGIFNPFYGLEDPQAGGDMGLGLYAARLNARRMGGDIRISSGPPATLEFEIPLQPAAGPPTRLIIDATPRRGRWIGHSSGDERLLAASSWHAARRLLGSSTPSHIVIGAPADVDGGDLSHLLRERYPDAVVERLAGDGASGAEHAQQMPPRRAVRDSSIVIEELARSASGEPASHRREGHRLPENAY